MRCPHCEKEITDKIQIVSEAYQPANIKEYEPGKFGITSYEPMKNEAIGDVIRIECPHCFMELDQNLFPYIGEDGKGYTIND